MTFSNVTLTPPANASYDQFQAVNLVEEWLREGPQEVTLGGFAGSGKTTLIRSIVDSLSVHRVIVAAFTGKAVSVLQDKGIEAQTLHSLLYELEGAPEEWRVARATWVGAKRRLVSEGRFPTEEHVESQAKTHYLGDDAADAAYLEWESMVMEYGENLDPTPHWVDVSDIEADLVIVDEASMVSNQLYDSLRGHDVRLLFVGDHGQLEPIGENPGLMMDPQIRLETIHRQAAGSEIIQFAHHLRTGGDPRHWKGTGADVTINPREHVRYGDFDTIICGFNDRRVHLNRVVRNELGFSGALPQHGEKLICLQNNRRKGIFNGLICLCLNVETTDDDNVILLTVPNAVGNPVTVSAWLPQFGEEKQAPYLGRHMSMFDWGYCLTCHKAQGSEFDNVAVVEQISYRWTAERWRYTAATRAAKKLTYLC
jgi:exodeoxyribonuclease-5